MGVASRSIQESCMKLKDASQAKVLERFFKCGPGEYGEGDKFLGLKVPQTRKIVKTFAKEADLNDVNELLFSDWHEIRLAGFFLLKELYAQAKKQKDNSRKEQIVDFYLKSLERCNNWDLVDLSAPYILGEEALESEKALLEIYKLSSDNRLWHRRVGIVSLITLIRNGRLEEIYEIAPLQFKERHDLIRKATGWMLREAGKKDENRLKNFLSQYDKDIPRITYSYAMEIIKRKEK